MQGGHFSFFLFGVVVAAAIVAGEIIRAACCCLSRIDIISLSTSIKAAAVSAPVSYIRILRKSKKRLVSLYKATNRHLLIF